MVKVLHVDAELAIVIFRLGLYVSDELVKGSTRLLQIPENVGFVHGCGLSI
jgi:hypothetical protein